jgi:hypothetical protein
MLGQFGITGDAANAYVDKLGLIPGNVDTAVNANTDDAQAKVENLIGAIAAIHDKTVTLTVRQQADAVKSADYFYQTYAQADGGLMEFYARGGMREQHVAQIAPAGAWRVWAEPETGGEAYIPLAQAKRARSLNILEETARRFGYGLNPFADGGFMRGDRIQYAAPTRAQQSASGGSRVVVQNLNVHNPRQLTTGGSTVAGLRHMDMELSLG